MTAGLEISDCVIYDIKPDDTGLGFSAADAIEVTAAGTFPNQRLSGDFRVVNNRIRRASLVDYPPQFIEGGVILNLSSMTTSIVANEIEGFAFVGIGIDRNDGPVTIAGNRVINCGHGGALLALPSSSGIGFRGTTAPALVERNTITGGYAGPSQSFLSRIAFGLASSNVVLRSNSVGGAFVLEPVLLSTFVDTARSRSFSATDNRIETNDLSEATGNQAQVVLDQASDRNRFANNDYGSVGAGAEAGVVVRSANNAFVNEDFWGTYTGAPSQPCVKLTPTSSGNSVSAFKYQGAPQGFDVCQQVLDQGMNTVTGAQKCG